MKRKLIVGERIMYVNGERPANCVFCVTIEGAMLPEHLQAAFKKVLARHPLLRASVIEDPAGEPYFDIQDNVMPASVEIRSRDTDEDWVRVTQAEWQRPFDYAKAPLMRVLWLKGAQVSDLMIVLPHCICDGASIVTIMRELLAFASNADQDVIPYQSFLHAADLVAVNELPGKGALTRARLLSFVARGVLSLLTLKKREASGTKFYLVRWSLDKALSEQLIAACKAGQTSVQAALGTAFLMAFGRIIGKDARNKLICPVDIRKAVPGIKDDMMFAFAPVVQLSGAGKGHAGFWDEARRMKADLQQKISKLKPNDLLVLTEYFHGAVDKMVKHLRTSNGGHDITLSNMGRINIPTAYQGFSLKCVYSPSAGLPWKNPNTLVVTTFDGQLDFSLISEETFLAQEKAQLVRDELISLLKEVIPA